jgi:hypothetical protein
MSQVFSIWPKGSIKYAIILFSYNAREFLFAFITSDISCMSKKSLAGISQPTQISDNLKHFKIRGETYENQLTMES